jgi:RHS repeat-associated protein
MGGSGSGSTYGYTYDTVGNRLSATVNGTTTSRTYDAANQVSGWTYDAAGNLTSDGTSSYTYDLLNRLRSVTKAGTTTNFGYHGEELIQQATGGTTTTFAQDRMGGLSQVLQTVQGGTTTTFAYGLDRLSTLTGATRTWDMADALGSVHGSLDNLGVLSTSQQYDPWGQPTGTNQPAPFGFTGEYQDGVSGLVYLRARWYHPGQGTLLGRDPFDGWATAPNSLHPYMYGANNPVTYGDPSGECYGPLDWLRWIEDTNCTNLDSAIRIVSNPKASGEGEAWAWGYIGVWTAAHVALMVSAGILLWEAPAVAAWGRTALAAARPYAVQAIAAARPYAVQAIAAARPYAMKAATVAATYGPMGMAAMSSVDDLMMTATMAVSDDPNDIADAQAWYGVSAADGQLPFGDGIAFCGLFGLFGKGFMKGFNKLFQRGATDAAQNLSKNMYYEYKALRLQGFSPEKAVTLINQFRAGVNPDGRFGFHFTSAENAPLIVESRMIKVGPRGLRGPGVYAGTTPTPSWMLKHLPAPGWGLFPWTKGYPYPVRIPLVIEPGMKPIYLTLPHKAVRIPLNPGEHQPLTRPNIGE